LYDFWFVHYLFSNPEFSLWLMLNSTAEPDRQQTISFALDIQASWPQPYNWLCFFKQPFLVLAMNYEPRAMNQNIGFVFLTSKTGILS
jgi:hypothetical protein